MQKEYFISAFIDVSSGYLSKYFIPFSFTLFFNNEASTKVLPTSQQTTNEVINKITSHKDGKTPVTTSTLPTSIKASNSTPSATLPQLVHQPVQQPSGLSLPPHPQPTTPQLAPAKMMTNQSINPNYNSLPNQQINSSLDNYPGYHQSYPDFHRSGVNYNSVSGSSSNALIKGQQSQQMHYGAVGSKHSGGRSGASASGGPANNMSMNQTPSMAFVDQHCMHPGYHQV